MPILEIRHPLIRHKLGLMRRADISTKNFRELAQEVGALLTYEATKDLPLESYDIEGWCGTVSVEKIAGKKITVVPILRAGIGMCPPYCFSLAGVFAIFFSFLHSRTSTSVLKR